MDQLDKALVNAVHAIANKKLQAAVNAAKSAVQNPTPQNQANLQRSLQAAQAPVQLAQQIAPNQPVNQTMQKNVNGLIRRIQQKELNDNIMYNPTFNITKNKNYNTSKKNNINQAIKTRKINLKLIAPPLPPKPSTPISLINL